MDIHTTLRCKHLWTGRQIQTWLPDTGSKKIFFNTSRCSTTSMSSVPNTSSGHTSLHHLIFRYCDTRTDRHRHTHLAALTRAIHWGYFPSLSSSRVLAIAENLTRCIYYTTCHQKLKTVTFVPQWVFHWQHQRERDHMMLAQHQLPSQHRLSCDPTSLVTVISEVISLAN